MAVAITALVIASSGTAIAASHLVNGNSLIKKGTLSGNRLRNHTVTGKQVNMSKLGTVGNANALGGHPASAYALNAPLKFTAPSMMNSWANSTVYGTYPAGYAKDGFGIVHLRGAVSGGSSDTAAFTLPAGMRPGANMWLPIYTYGGSEGTLIIQTDGQVIPYGSETPQYTSLDGVTFPAG